MSCSPFSAELHRVSFYNPTRGPHLLRYTVYTSPMKRGTKRDTDYHKTILETPRQDNNCQKKFFSSSVLESVYLSREN